MYERFWKGNFLMYLYHFLNVTFAYLLKVFNSPGYPELSHKVEKLSTKSIFVTDTNAECKTDLPVLIGKLI